MKLQLRVGRPSVIFLVCRANTAETVEGRGFASDHHHHLLLLLGPQWGIYFKRESSFKFEVSADVLPATKLAVLVLIHKTILEFHGGNNFHLVSI